MNGVSNFSNEILTSLYELVAHCVSPSFEEERSYDITRIEEIHGLIASSIHESLASLHELVAYYLYPNFGRQGLRDIAKIKTLIYTL